MITFLDYIDDEPHNLFYQLYNEALKKKQVSIEAVHISSWDESTNEADSRIVNLKYIKTNEWIFFSNFDSPKSNQFDLHNKITAIFFWPSINSQIRIKAKIYKTNASFCDEHYKKRSTEKNALAHSSEQSKIIGTYNEVVDNYNKALKNTKMLLNRPKNWGGFSFIPYKFEFWKGHNSRLNKRDVFIKENNSWKAITLQP